MSQLNSSVARISASLNTILDLSDRRIRALSSRLTGMFNFIIALLALLVGLAQILGAAQTGVSANSEATAPSSFIGALVDSPEISSAARLLFEFVGVLLIAAAGLYGIEWAIQRLPRRRHRFIVDVQRFRALVRAAAAHVSRAIATSQDEMWHRVDVLDDEATQLLGSLWKELRRGVGATGGKGTHAGRVGRFASRSRPQSVREWEARARVLEHAIELFDLSPRTIVLPRALCILRFKSMDFQTRAPISDWDFGESLRVLGFSSMQVDAIESWLSNHVNQQQIRDWDVATFVNALKQRGVTAVPGNRTPHHWYGPLDRT